MPHQRTAREGSDRQDRRAEWYQKQRLAGDQRIMTKKLTTLSLAPEPQLEPQLHEKQQQQHQGHRLLASFENQQNNVKRAGAPIKRHKV